MFSESEWHLHENLAPLPSYITPAAQGQSSSLIAASQRETVALIGGSFATTSGALGTIVICPPPVICSRIRLLVAFFLGYGARHVSSAYADRSCAWALWELAGFQNIVCFWPSGRSCA
jgi:hypothetical protein